MQDRLATDADQALFDLVRDHRHGPRQFEQRLAAAIADGASVNARDEQGRTPLMIAAEQRAVPEEGRLPWTRELGAERVLALLQARAFPYAVDAQGRGALHRAAAGDDAEAAQALLGYGADPGEPDNLGATPLHHAARAGAARSILLLGEAGANLFATDAARRSPLQLATLPGAEQPAAVGALLRLGEDLESPTAEGQRLGDWIREQGVATRVAALCDAQRRSELNARVGPIDWKAVDRHGIGGLHEALRQGQATSAAFFLSLGANPNAIDRFGRSPLAIAAASPHPDTPLLIERLVARGAVVDFLGPGGNRMSPLHLASHLDLPRNVEALLKAGADPMLGREREAPAGAADYAAMSGAAGALRALIAHGVAAGPGALGEDWPLVQAARRGHLECCQILLEAGAPLDAPGVSGQTALEAATLSKEVAVSDYLRSPAARDLSEGKTPPAPTRPPGAITAAYVDPGLPGPVPGAAVGLGPAGGGRLAQESPAARLHGPAGIKARLSQRRAALAAEAAREREQAEAKTPTLRPKKALSL